MHEEEKRLSFFFLGLTLGVATGILLAPTSGGETRKFLRHKADEGTDFIKRQGKGLRDSASEYVEKGRTVISKQRDNLSEAIDAGKAAYREATSVGGI